MGKEIITHEEAKEDIVVNNSLEIVRERENGSKTFELGC
jgi:hypothetical protein